MEAFLKQALKSTEKHHPKILKEDSLSKYYMKNNFGLIGKETVLEQVERNEDKMNSNTHEIIIGDSRKMKEVNDKTIHLIVTSPPYPMIEMWDKLFEKNNCKTYDEMHDYLASVWKECYRVLVDGGIMCINIGDAARRIDHSFKLFPNHSRVIEKCEEMGFMTLPYILWKKPTNKPNAFLGSGFIPPNGYVTLDCEYILIFRKGLIRKFTPKDEKRYASQFTKEERDRWFSQIWTVNGATQTHSELVRRTGEYPEEIVKRLVKMFSCIGETVLDPFLGTGTTTKIAKELNRNSIGYEIEKQLIPVIKEKTGFNQQQLGKTNNFEFIEQQ